MSFQTFVPEAIERRVLVEWTLRLQCWKVLRNAVHMTASNEPLPVVHRDVFEVLVPPVHVLDGFGYDLFQLVYLLPDLVKHFQCGKDRPFGANRVGPLSPGLERQPGVSGLPAWQQPRIEID
jgi:hypothetical protein